MPRPPPMMRQVLSVMSSSLEFSGQTGLAAGRGGPIAARRYLRTGIGSHSVGSVADHPFLDYPAMTAGHQAGDLAILTGQADVEQAGRWRGHPDALFDQQPVLAAAKSVVEQAAERAGSHAGGRFLGDAVARGEHARGGVGL